MINLFITLGTVKDGRPIHREWEQVLSEGEYAQFLGLEIPVEPTEDDPSSRTTIVRIPFTMDEADYVKPTYSEMANLVKVYEQDLADANTNFKAYRERIKTLEEWPMYVTDNDVIWCNMLHNGQDCEGRFISYGRRKTFGEIQKDLIKHIEEQHS
jgi:hypothetical protein